MRTFRLSLAGTVILALLGGLGAGAAGGDADANRLVDPVGDPIGDAPDIVAATTTATPEELVLEVELADDWVLPEMQLLAWFYPDPTSMSEGQQPLPRPDYCNPWLMDMVFINVPLTSSASVEGKDLRLTIPLAKLGDPETLGMHLWAKGRDDTEESGDHFPDGSETCLSVPLGGAAGPGDTTDEVAAQQASPSATTEEMLAGMVTEEVEPGVERIIGDGAGHDLDETHPTYRYDMDAIAVAADGTVWLATTHHGSDNPGGAHLFALGRPGTYPRPAWVGSLIPLADGTLLASTDEGLLRFDGERWVADDGPRLRPTADGGLLLRLEGADLADELSQGQAANLPDLHAYWGDGWGWADLWELGRLGVNAGDYWCWLDEGSGWSVDGSGVRCEKGAGGWTTGEPTMYLAGTSIHQLAGAPDGSVWAVGEYDGGPGGLYRITPSEPYAE